MSLNAKCLKARLLLNGMTQRDLANATGISYNMISLICRGASCSDETAEKIAVALGITPEQLTQQVRI